VGTGYVPVSTYATAATNPPGEYPSGVTNLNGTSGGASVTDRYWNITLGSAEFATTRPTATMTFTALNTEKPTTWTAIGEPPTNTNNLLAQRWNTAAYWDPAQTSPAQTYANNSPAAGTFQVGVPSVTNYSTSWTITDSSVPLPITLKSFAARLRNERVEVVWETETEVDNDYFTVQRTTDGEFFEEVVRVDGQGTSATAKKYVAYDVTPTAGRGYYRLRQTDFDGKTSYSKLVAVDVPASYFRNVYPNPSNGEDIYLAFPNSDAGKTAWVRISDLNGRNVFEGTVAIGNSDARLKLYTAVPAGVYILSLAVESEVKHFKLIVR